MGTYLTGLLPFTNAMGDFFEHLQALKESGQQLTTNPDLLKQHNAILDSLRSARNDALVAGVQLGEPRLQMGAALKQCIDLADAYQGWERSGMADPCQYFADASSHSNQTLIDLLRIACARAEQEVDDPKDNSKDTPKKREKYGPRNTTEFLLFKAAILKGQKKNRSKKAIATEFADGDSKKAAALLKQLNRHKKLPE